jgi:hypothetical protein
MNAPGAGIESFSANIASIIGDTIGEKLRNEALGALRLARDDALQSLPPHPETMPYIAHQIHSYMMNCHTLFNQDRPAIHKVIDDLFDEIEEEVRQELEDSSPLSRPQPTIPQPIFPQPISMRFVPATRPTGADEYNASQPKAPVADMDSPDLGIQSPRRSVSPLDILPSASLELLATDMVPRVSEAVSFTEAGSPAATIPPASGTKRPAAIAGTHIANEPNKRVKTTERPMKKTVPHSKIKTDEYIFVPKGYEGRYVYRCNRSKCKDRLGRNPVYFTNARTARTHFIGEGHSIGDKDEIFQKWAHLGKSKAHLQMTCV